MQRTLLARIWMIGWTALNTCKSPNDFDKSEWGTQRAQNRHAQSKSKACFMLLFIAWDFLVHHCASLHHAPSHSLWYIRAAVNSWFFTKSSTSCSRHIRERRSGLAEQAYFKRIPANIGFSTFFDFLTFGF